MPTRISTEDVAHVARLARLALTDEELERFTEQLGAVLEHAQDVEALDTAGVPPTAHPLPLVNVLREDVVRPEPRPGRGAGPGARRGGGPLPGAPDPRGGPVSGGPPAAVSRPAGPGAAEIADGCPVRPASQPGPSWRSTWPASRPPRPTSTPSTW